MSEEGGLAERVADVMRQRGGIERVETIAATLGVPRSAVVDALYDLESEGRACPLSWRLTEAV
jgi:alkyl hydroperoxide reductase subunit AhpC